ncbi:SH3 domain-containing protein [Streptomyces sp. NBC_00133]|uniref:SH3 domain-containing protein n=1 Tax=Streptomyces sp. NBC_00133 TaxID=2903624 RepID=UPI0032503F02
MVKRTKAMASIAVGALCVGLLMTGAATAQASALGLPYGVTPYENVNVRAEATTASAIVGHVKAGEPRGASCWKHGQLIKDNGYSNDIWVRLAEGYVSAVYLKGDERGGVPASAEC